MPKSNVQKKQPQNNHSSLSLSTGLQFARLLIHRHLPLGRNQPQKKNDAPHLISVTEEAYHKIHVESDGRLVLMEGSYLGDDVRHLLYCHDCKNDIMASYNEIKAGTNICPHCHGDEFLERFTDIREMQEYFLDVSLRCAYFLGRNRLGGTMQELRDMYCLIHKVPYEASMAEFFADDSTNGCPACIKERQGGIKL